MNIGVFDSGLGGLTIFNELIKKLPEYNYIYLGDNARVPYGGRSQKIIYEFTKQAVEFLFKKDCAIIILACNTATAAALRRIQQEYLPKHYPDRRVLGVIRPTVEMVAEGKANRVGVIATKATVASKSFVKEIYKLNPKIKVFQNSGPLLVPFIEKGETESEAFKVVLKKYLQPLIDKKIDILILGCTHYGLVKRQIQNIVGSKIQVIDEANIVAEKLRIYFNKHIDIKERLQKKHLYKLYVTDFPYKNIQSIDVNFNDNIKKTEIVKI